MSSISGDVLTLEGFRELVRSGLRVGPEPVQEGARREYFAF